MSACRGRSRQISSKAAVIHALQGIPGAAARAAPMPGDAGYAALHRSENARAAAAARARRAAARAGAYRAPPRASRAPCALPAGMLLPWCASRRVPRRTARACARFSPEAAAMRAASIRVRAPSGRVHPRRGQLGARGGEVAGGQRRFAELAAVMRRIGGTFELLLGRQLAPRCPAPRASRVAARTPTRAFRARRRDSASRPAGCAAFPRRDP